MKLSCRLEKVNISADIDKLVHAQDSLITSVLESKWSSKLDIEKDLQSLNASIKEYRTTFTKIAAAYQKRGFKDYGDEGELRKAIRAVEESSYKLDMVKLLNLRRIEKDFFLRKDTSDAN